MHTPSEDGLLTGGEWNAQAVSGRNPRTRHEQDLSAWAHEQATFLRQGTWHALDLEHLSEEIDDVGHSQQDKLARCPFHKFAASYAAARLYGLGG